jgi:hypothetical protein
MWLHLALLIPCNSVNIRGKQALLNYDIVFIMPSSMSGYCHNTKHAVISPLIEKGGGTNLLLSPYKTNCYNLALLLL